MLAAALIAVDQRNIAAYTAATLDDPRTQNQTLYIAPPANCFWSQNEMISLYEQLSGQQVERHPVSAEELRQRIAGRPNTVAHRNGHMHAIITRRNL